MFGLPIWAIELLIAFLKATGAVSLAASLSARAILWTDKKLQNLQTYHEASDFPSPPPPLNTNRNFNK